MTLSTIITPSPLAVELDDTHQLRARIGDLTATRSSVRELAVLADQSTNVELSLALLWRELRRGLCRVVDTFFSGNRCFVLTAATQAPFVEVEARRMKILEAVLTTGGQKAVAIEMKVSAATVAGNARQALDAFGADSKPSRCHPLLVLAANAERTGDSNWAGALSFVALGGSQLRVISIVRPDSCLTLALPQGECAVARSLVEGLCYAEIARRRGTSQRTVANQLAAVFRRLKVSGRGELLLRLFAQRN